MMNRKKWLILLVVALVCSFISVVYAQQYKLKQKASVDLNADRKKEQIWVQPIVEGNLDYVLHINTVSIKGSFHGGDVEDFDIVDIDTTDKLHEIAVHTSGPSDDDEYNIYWFDGKKIQLVGEVARWPNFTGKGIVYVKDWMGFWELTNRYILDKKTHKLEETPQEFNYVGVRGKVGKSIQLFATRRDVFKKNGTVIVNLRKGSSVLILLWEPTTNLYLIKSESGIVGWITEKNLYNNIADLPAAD